jgi:PAS domain S-box-containing protein
MMDPPEPSADRCTREICKRSVAASFGYPILFVVLGLGTQFRTERPMIVAVAGVVLAAFAALRLWTARCMLTDAAHRHLSARKWFFAATYGSAFAWSAFCVSILVLHGLDWEGFFALLLTAGFASGAVTSLSPSPPLAWRYLVLLLGPIVGWSIGQGGPEAWLSATAVAVYWAILLKQIKEQFAWYQRGVRDTAQKEVAKAQAERTNRLLEATLESTADGILVVDRRGHVTCCNAKFLKLWGIADDVAAAGRDMQLLDAVQEQFADPAGFRREVEELYLHPERVTKDTLYFQDGRVFERYSQPQTVGAQIVGRVWSFRDVTEHRATLRQLQQSEERWQLVMRGNNDGLWDWDAKTDEVFYSARWKKMLGYEDSELPNSTSVWESLLHPRDKDRVLRELREHFSGKTDYYTTEYRIRAKDGSYKWILARGQALWNADGRPTRMVGSHTDITARKRSEEALNQAMEDAKAASRAKSAFLANMSHELRTPMTGVLGMIDLVVSSDLEAEQRQQLEMARLSAESLLVLLNEVLDLSKIEAGRMEVAKTSFSVRSCVMEAVRLFQALAQEKGLSLTAEVEEPVPDLLSGDPVRLRQILVNLVGNALKFTDAGSVTVCTKLASRTASEVVLQFRVTDTGIGIPEHMHRYVFEPFCQADGSSTRRHGGTGLGLTICDRLARLMGGEIQLDSSEGNGSTFRLKLSFPVESPHADTEPHKDVHALTAATSDSQHSCRRLEILVAEDNVVNQKLVAEMLRREGHFAVVVPNGAEAVEACRVRRFDLVLMDVQMPRMDGLAAAAAIHQMELQTGRHTWIVAMTAHAMIGDREKCLPANMDDYLTKPLARAHLRAMLYSRA